MNVNECPGCGEPLNGRTCKKCGYDPSTDETVRCADCGDETTKESAVEVREKSGLMGRLTTNHYCTDCS